MLHCGATDINWTSKPPVFAWINKLSEFSVIWSYFWLWLYLTLSLHLRSGDDLFLLLNVTNAIAYFSTSSSNAANVRLPLAFSHQMSFKCVDTSAYTLHTLTYSHFTDQNIVKDMRKIYGLCFGISSIRFWRTMVQCALWLFILRHEPARPILFGINQHLNISKVNISNTQRFDVIFPCANCLY